MEVSAKSKLPKLIAIVGPTASGKTDLAVALAKKFRGEVISADSRQFYRGTDIGSDIIPGKWVKRGSRKVYLARGVPHHLIAFRSPAQPVTVAEFQALARRRAREIIGRGRVPILAGGSGLYLRVVTDDFVIPRVPPQPRFRRRMDAISTAALYRRLVRLDPDYAGRISAGNRRYMIRALEVIGATGQPFSAQQATGQPVFDVLKLGVKRPRPQIYRRVEARVDEMIRRGLVKEADRLGRRHGRQLPALTALGHRQLGAYLRGQIPLEEAVRQIKRDTRRFAKRQLTWFRRDKDIRWVKNASAAEKIAADFLG